MNGYRIIDIIRSTNVVKVCNKYRKLIESENIHDAAIMMQRDNLMNFLLRLRNNCFYGPFLKGVSDEEICSDPYGVLREFPIADKQLIRDNFEKIRNRSYRGENAYTGGSTGSPFHYFVDKRLLSNVTGFTLFLWHHLGKYDFGTQVIAVGGTSIGGRSNLKKRLLHYLQKRTYVSGGEINESNARKLVSLINDAKKPVALYGYPSSICEYILLIRKMGLTVEMDNIKSIYTTSETLTPLRRKNIEDFFGRNVVNLYGARDGGISSGSLDDKTFIYNGIECYAENIDFDGTNELVITNLFSDAFPFVRYRIGDIADLSISKNGYPFVLNNLSGRTRDFITLPNGNKIHGSMVNKVFSHYDIAEYQIVQYSSGNCCIRIVELDRINRDLIASDISQLMPEVKFTIEVVDTIPRQKNSKLRNIISEIE